MLLVALYTNPQFTTLTVNVMESATTVVKPKLLYALYGVHVTG